MDCSETTPKPAEWWLRPVMSAARVGEHRAVECMHVYRSPAWPRRSNAGVGMTPPNVLGAPKPTSSVMMRSTLGALLGGTTRGAHHAFDWKPEDPTSNMRVYQFKLPKAEGDKEDAELIVYFFKTFSGSAEDNLKRQTAKFEPAAGKDKVEESLDKKFKVGPLDAVYQDVKGAYLSKFPPFAPNAKITRKENYRQLYVVFEGKEGQYYVALLGPEKTVEKHKKAFDEWVKAFK